MIHWADTAAGCNGPTTATTATDFYEYEGNSTYTRVPVYEDEVPSLQQLVWAINVACWPGIQERYEHRTRIMLMVMFNVWCASVLRRRLLFPKSGFIGRAGRRKFN